MNIIVTATPKKIVTHIMFHEIRHWAQIATLWRLNGLKEDFHDFLFSPVMGGELRRETQTAQTEFRDSASCSQGLYAGPVG